MKPVYLLNRLTIILVINNQQHLLLIYKYHNVPTHCKTNQQGQILDHFSFINKSEGC